MSSSAWRSRQNRTAPGCWDRRRSCALTGKPADTSPTARGLFVREQFLCQHVPDPPPGRTATCRRCRPSKPLTNRERLSMHLQSPICASCHKLIDPIGFGFEKFDAIGGRREKLVLTFRPGRKDRDRPRRRRKSPWTRAATLPAFRTPDFIRRKSWAGCCRQAPSASSAS